MLGKYKVCMAITCYKRPEFAKRLVDSIIKTKIDIDKIFILLMPIEFELNIDSKKVEIIKCQQMNCSRARNYLVNYIIDKYDFDLIWLTDDDVIYDNGINELASSLHIFENKEIGIASITRRMWNYKYEKQPEYTNFVYIGGGYIFRPKLFKLIEGFDEDDGADELLFNLKSYLSGHKQVRFRNCSAIHEQGCVSNGGLYSLVREEGVDNLKDTKLLKDNYFIKVKSERTRYGGVYGFDTGGLKNCQLTKLSKLMHNRNRIKLLNGTLSSSNIPFTSKYKGDIFLDEVIL